MSQPGAAEANETMSLADETDQATMTHVPDAIPIAYEADYRTDTIGTYDDGQFYADIHGACRGEPSSFPKGETRWYLYVHTFDRSGNYRSSEIELIKVGGFLDEYREPALARLAQLLDALPGRAFGDIRIKPFRTSFDGVVFGLIDETEERDGLPWFELYPDRLGFAPPWNGDYST
jgi:hypothetical protein